MQLKMKCLENKINMDTNSVSIMRMAKQTLIIAFKIFVKENIMKINSNV